MAELKALLFDVDGTLANTEETHRQAFNQIFAEYDLEWQWSVELYTALLKVTGGKERMKHYLDAYHPPFPAVVDRDAFFADIHKQKTQRYAELVSKGIPLRTGVRRLLAEARQTGIRLAIVTTTSLPNVTALLEHSLAPEALQWFAAIGAGDIVAAKKPAADIYHYVLKALDLPPENCLAVEDSANGLRSALGASVPTLVTLSDYTRNDRFDGAALVVDHLGEPDQPFTVLASKIKIEKEKYVSIDLLRRLIA